MPARRATVTGDHDPVGSRHRQHGGAVDELLAKLRGQRTTGQHTGERLGCLASQRRRERASLQVERPGQAWQRLVWTDRHAPPPSLDGERRANV
jgi:hypothetical protein